MEGKKVWVRNGKVFLDGELSQADILIQDGKVAGIGSHEQLFKNCPEYHEICLSQLSHEEVNRR